MIYNLEYNCAKNKIGKFLNDRFEVLVCLFLVLVTLVVYLQVGTFEFINYDTDLYVYDNRQVKAGFTKTSIAWAFTTFHAYNWHPLTWLTHMVDVQLFGMDSGRHHLTNVFIHIMNTLLLFGILRRMTGDLWQSSLVAALFAIHPLHIQSVAWVAERKDVLSTFFGFLAVGSYLQYVRGRRLGWYMPVLISFVLSLMCKPMLVTLPFVLLLLDYWPLKRLHFQMHREGSSASLQMPTKVYLVVEKIPLFIFSTVSCIITFYAQRAGGSIASTDLFPLHIRVINALNSYIGYIGKMFWPSKLSIIYPYNKIFLSWQIWASCLLMVSISLLAIKYYKSRPWFLVGWLWYLGTLVPVIGLVQVGSQALADRYTYVPLIGLFIIIAWGLHELSQRWRYKELCFVIILLAISGTLMVVSRQQVRYWKNGVTLFKHAINVTENNSYAQNILGHGLLMEGKIIDAIKHLKRSSEANPRYSKVHNNLGVALAQQGDTEGAINCFQNALQINPNYADAHNNLGVALRGKGQTALAANHFSAAIRLSPAYAEAYNNLGILLLNQGKYKTASTYFKKALEENPDFIRARENLKRVSTDIEEFQKDITILQLERKKQPRNAQICLDLGNLYKQHGDLSAAAKQYQNALSLQPDLLPALKNLAIIQAARGKYDNAIELFEDIIVRKSESVEPYYYIAAIYSRQGKINQSIHWLKKAVAKGYNNWDNLRKDNNFNNLKNTLYYKKLMENESILHIPL